MSSRQRQGVFSSIGGAPIALRGCGTPSVGVRQPVAGNVTVLRRGTKSEQGAGCRPRRRARLSGILLCLIAVQCAVLTGAHAASPKGVDTPAPLNEQAVFAHAQAADAASARGDWNTARREWGQTVHAAEQIKLPPIALAVIYYEYGRAAGVTCRFKVAATYLNKAYQLDRRNDGPQYLALVELARLNLDRGKYALAVRYFEQAIPLLEHIGAPRQAPAEFARVLDEYAVGLRARGRTRAAAQVAARAAALRQHFPDYHSMSERTPYARSCPSPQ